MSGKQPAGVKGGGRPTVTGQQPSTYEHGRKIGNWKLVTSNWLGATFFLGLLLFCSACAMQPMSDRQPVGGSQSAIGSQSATGRSGKAAAATHAPQKLKLLVGENGIYRITAAELEANGLVLGESLDYGSVRIADGPEPVPFLVDGDALIFYGRASDERYYAERPYILETGVAGRAMEQRAMDDSSGPSLQNLYHSLRLEENHNYVPEARLDEGSEVWFWSKLAQQDIFSAQFTLPVVTDQEATLRLNAWGFTHNPEVANDHDLDVFVNDVAVGKVAWDGQTSHTAAISIPGNVLRRGANTITLDNRPEGASFLDIIQVNWLELDYAAPAAAIHDRANFTAESGVVTFGGLGGVPVVLDVSDPAQPVQIVGRGSGDLQLAVSADVPYAISGPQGFLKPRLERVSDSSWTDTGRQADLIIITSDDLAPALAPLVAARQAQGLQVALVKINEIYDEFGYGAPSPESIRSFVRYAHQNWHTPRPRYLLLVGDATSDYLGYLQQPAASFIPSLLVPVQFSGETVSDSRLADVDDDLRPDLAVGRWPARTADQVADLVARTIAYEEGAASDRVIFATDGSDGSFSAIAGRLIEEGRIRRESVEQRDGPTPTEIGELWRDGAWLATYVGHGSIDRWGKEDIFSLDELGDLESDSTPIVLQLTCLTGLFSHPEQISLSEAMLLHPSGPVLNVAASSLTLSAQQEPFAVELLRQLQDNNIQRVGDAFLAAKRSLDVENSDGLREISDTFALLGDPSAKIVRP